MPSKAHLNPTPQIILKLNQGGFFVDNNFTASETTALTTSVLDTPDNITIPKLKEEIKSHLNQINKNYIEIGNHTVEIGKRLIQAKSLLKHGEWIKWLQDNFQLSYRMASKFMQCAERFSNVPLKTHLNQTQMVELLSLPNAEETERFIEQKAAEGTPVSDMPIKTLRNELKQWKAENEEITLSNSVGDEENDTIDITPNNSPQKQDESVSSVPSEQDTTSFVNPELPEQSLTDFHQPYSEMQSRVDETPHKSNDKEPIILEPPSEIQGTYLIDGILSMCNSLIRHENQDEIIRTFAKNNPDQINTGIQNLTAIISKLQAIKKND